MIIKESEEGQILSKIYELQQLARIAKLEVDIGDSFIYIKGEKYDPCQSVDTLAEALFFVRGYISGFNKANKENIEKIKTD